MSLLKTTFTRTGFLLLLLLSVFGSKKASADHIAAVDLYADFIGADSLNMKYRVTLVIYKNCQGTTTLGTTQLLTIRSVQANFNFTRNMPMFGQPDTLDQLCNSSIFLNRCRSAASIFPGFERRRYVDTITVPARSKDLIFSWTLCCRSTVANLQPQGQSFYIEASVNNLARYNNNTPRYLIDPIPYICNNQPNQFINAPSDPDLDSMVTFSMLPMSAPATNINHTPFTLANPLGSVTGYNVNPTTGTATFTAGNTGLYVVAFRTFEYDKYTGEPMGYISRDVQLSVVTCAAPAPSVDSVPANIVGGNIVQPGNIISVCPNAKVSFDVIARSLSGNNVLKLTANNALTANGSTFIQGASVGGVATGKFEWIPTTADIGDHIVIFTAEDTTCNPSQPINLKNYQVVTIRVLPGLDVGPDQKICPLGDNPVSLSVSGPQTNTYSWKRLDGANAEFISCLNCPAVTVTPPYDYTYIVSSSNPIFVCKSSDTVVVRVDHSNGVIATQDPLIVCRPSYITLTADSVGLSPLSNLQCGTLNPQNCTTPDQLTIGTPGNVASDQNNSPFNSSYKYHKYQFIITKQEMKNAGVYSGTLKSIAFMHHNPVVLGTNPLANVRVSLKCTRNTRYPSVVTNADFQTGTTTVATVPVYALTANGWNNIPFSAPYNWDTTQNLIVDICIGDAGFTPNVNGLDPVDMVPGQAIQKWSNTTDICAANSNDVKLYTQRPVVRFDYCEAPSLPFDYRWAPGTYLADSNVKSPVAYVPFSGSYAVYTRGRNGCLVRDSLHITVPIHHLTISNDTAVCVGQPAPLHAGGASAGYIWYENGFNTPTTLSCNNCADPVSTPVVPGDITYTVVYRDTADCFDTLQMTVHAYPLPSVVIGNNDTIINYGQSVQLIVTGANSYSWTPAGSLTDPNIPNPVAHPTVTTEYIVYGLNQYNCRSSDTVKITIDNRDNLLVPSGFTPNGDGKNDYFKVVNMTFQKLMEFRVFNRWGQEVFSTTDPMRGWDGTWKGVEQDMGNYTYIIRVAYPDGYTETYKGDVTLIR